MKRSITRLAALSLALIALHEGMALGLDRAELIERLLSPGDPSVIVVLFVGVCFYALRLVLLFVLPGVWLFALIRVALASLNRRKAVVDTSTHAASHRAHP